MSRHSYSFLKATLDSYRSDFKPVILWKAKMFRGGTEALDYYSGLLVLYYGATREDFDSMTTEERLTFLHLFGG